MATAYPVAAARASLLTRVSTPAPVQPIFLLNSKLPLLDGTSYSVIEICRSAEQTSGHNTIDGAQQTDWGELWQIYPLTQQARLDLLSEGIVLRGETVIPNDKHPFVVPYGNGERMIQTTKVIIGNIPLSYSNQEIEEAIIRLPSVTKRSKVFDEKAREENGHLTNFKTGRRYIYIEVPPQPLPYRTKIGNYTATLYHKEQRRMRKCRNCLQQHEHDGRSCDRPVKCRTCMEDGHRAGAPECRLTSAEPTATQEDAHEEASEQGQQGEAPNHNPQATTSLEPHVQLNLPTSLQPTSLIPTSTLPPNRDTIAPPSPPNRSRSRMKQTQLQLQNGSYHLITARRESRGMSETPERLRSGEREHRSGSRPKRPRPDTTGTDTDDENRQAYWDT